MFHALRNCSRKPLAEWFSARKPCWQGFRAVAPAQSDSLFLCYSDPVSKSLAMIERRVALFAHLHVNKDAAPEMYRLPIQAGGFLTLT